MTYLSKLDIFSEWDWSSDHILTYKITLSKIPEIPYYCWMNLEIGVWLWKKVITIKKFKHVHVAAINDDFDHNTLS